MKTWLAATLAASAFLACGGALAHGELHSAPKKRALSGERHPWGREGDPKRASRTVEVRMHDTMRFSPSELQLKRGETVRFRVRNDGQAMHEMVIGTREELERHAEMMRKHPGMEHDEPYMAHVSPGKSGEIFWTFDQPGTFMYGCLIPGHWEAGMKGTIVVAR